MEHQGQDEEHKAPPTTRGRRNKVLQIVRDMHEFVGALRASTRESKQRNMYKALVTEVIDRQRSNYHEVAQYQVWQDAMVEYNSIMLNDV